MTSSSNKSGRHPRGGRRGQRNSTNNNNGAIKAANVSSEPTTRPPLAPANVNVHDVLYQLTNSAAIPPPPPPPCNPPALGEQPQIDTPAAAVANDTKPAVEGQIEIPAATKENTAIVVAAKPFMKEQPEIAAAKPESLFIRSIRFVGEIVATTAALATVTLQLGPAAGVDALLEEIDEEGELDELKELVTEAIQYVSKKIGSTKKKVPVTPAKATTKQPAAAATTAEHAAAESEGLLIRSIRYFGEIYASTAAFATVFRQSFRTGFDGVLDEYSYLL